MRRPRQLILEAGVAVFLQVLLELVMGFAHSLIESLKAVALVWNEAVLVCLEDPLVGFEIVNVVVDEVN